MSLDLLNQCIARISKMIQIHAEDSCAQELLKIELVTLIEDPQRATLRQLVSDAKKASSRTPAVASASHTEQRSPSIWIAGSPVAIKLRLFCLPYAGGVSENVFAR